MQLNWDNSFGRNSLVGLAVVVTSPLLSLLLTMLSLQELATRVLKIVL